MTSLAKIDARPVIRETGVSYRGRPIVVKLETGGKLIRFRFRRGRTWYTIPMETVFWQAAKAAAL
jgi:hypothetical protein